LFCLLRPAFLLWQLFDSYGKKCNSRFLLNYGFAVEENTEPNGECQNEVRSMSLSEVNTFAAMFAVDMFLVVFTVLA
jgi:hypothetical protein